MSVNITGAVGGLCGGLIALAFFVTAKLAADHVAERAAAWLVKRRRRKRPVTDVDRWRNAFENGLFVFSDDLPVKADEFLAYVRAVYDAEKEKHDER